MEEIKRAMRERLEAGLKARKHARDFQALSGTTNSAAQPPPPKGGKRRSHGTD